MYRLVIKTTQDVHSSVIEDDDAIKFVEGISSGFDKMSFLGLKGLFLNPKYVVSVELEDIGEID